MSSKNVRCKSYWTLCKLFIYTCTSFYASISKIIVLLDMVQFHIHPCSQCSKFSKMVFRFRLALAQSKMEDLADVSSPLPQTLASVQRFKTFHRSCMTVLMIISVLKAN